jgi:hypothetical protein
MTGTRFLASFRQAAFGDRASAFDFGRVRTTVQGYELVKDRYETYSRIGRGANRKFVFCLVRGVLGGRQAGRGPQPTAASAAPKCRTQITPIGWIAQIEELAGKQDEAGAHGRATVSLLH